MNLNEDEDYEYFRFTAGHANVLNAVKFSSDGDNVQIDWDATEEELGYEVEPMVFTMGPLQTPIYNNTEEAKSDFSNALEIERNADHRPSHGWYYRMNDSEEWTKVRSMNIASHYSDTIEDILNEKGEQFLKEWKNGSRTDVVKEFVDELTARVDMRDSHKNHSFPFWASVAEEELTDLSMEQLKADDNREVKSKVRRMIEANTSLRGRSAVRLVNRMESEGLLAEDDGPLD